MNAKTFKTIYENINGQPLYGSRKPVNYRRKNTRCPELDMIGNHVVNYGEASCKYCGVRV